MKRNLLLLAMMVLGMLFLISLPLQPKLPLGHTLFAKEVTTAQFGATLHRQFFDTGESLVPVELTEPMGQINSPPKNPSVCDMFLAGAYYYWTGWLTGQEKYAAWQDPESFGCSNVYPFQINGLQVVLYTSQAITLQLQPQIYDNGGTPSCPIPGTLISNCPSSIYTVTIPDSGGWIITFPETCCVDNDYFAAVNILTEGLSGKVFPVTQQIGAVPCHSYSDTGTGWMDMHGIGFTGKLALSTYGLTSDQNDCSLPFCSEDPNDLGICDTLHVETFDGDHIYEASAGYDSVRVAIYVTHDSNTFWWEGLSMWVQDSISGFTVPLNFWNEGCADSVVLPNWDNWNNTACNPYDPRMSRSMFRHLVDEHTGDTVYNRMLQMVEAGNASWNVYTDIESHSSESDSGHVFFSVVPMNASCQRWWEGNRVLLATMTFLVYMGYDCDTTAICLDSTFWPPNSPLTFARYDGVHYCPRHSLPVKDTIYTQPTHDVGVVSIVSPTQVPENIPLCPETMVKNYGGNNDTFYTFCQIDSGGMGIYLDSVHVVDLAYDSSTVVSFQPWTPDGAGNTYVMTIYTALPGDINPTNDVKTCTTETFIFDKQWFLGRTMFLIRSNCGTWTEFDAPLLFPGNSTEITLELINTGDLTIDSLEVILVYTPPGVFPTSDTIIEIDSLPPGSSSGPLPFTFYVSPFERGDISTDRLLDFSDPFFLRNYFYQGGQTPDPLLVADVNGDMVVNYSDLNDLAGFVCQQASPPDSQPVQNPPKQVNQQEELNAKDSDKDGKPDKVDKDDDNDGIPDYQDSAPKDKKKGRDTDEDGIPDPLDDDIDGDGQKNDVDQDDDGDGNPDDFEKRMIELLEKLNKLATQPGHESVERVIRAAMEGRHDFDQNGKLDDDDLFNKDDFPGSDVGIFKPKKDGKGIIYITPEGEELGENDLLRTMLHELRHAYQHALCGQKNNDKDNDRLPAEVPDKEEDEGFRDEDDTKPQTRQEVVNKLEADARKFEEHWPDGPPIFLASSDDTTYDFELLPNPDTLTVGSAEWLPGSMVSLPITLTHSDSLSGIVVPLSYDPSLLTVSDISISNIFSDWTQCIQVDSDSGKLMLQFFNSLEPPLADPLPPGTHELATIEFTLDSLVSDSTTYLQATTYPPVNYLLLVDVCSPPGRTIPVFVPGRIGFVSGDANGDGVIDLGDVLYLISYLYKGGPAPDPLEAGDVNCDETIDLGDVLYLISYLYKGGPAPCSGKAGGVPTNTSKLSGSLGHAEISLMLKSDPTNQNLTGFAKVSPEGFDEVFEISVIGEFDRDVAGVHLEIDFNPDEVTLLDPALTPLTRSLQLFSGTKDGTQKIGIVDLSGKEFLPPGEGTLVNLWAKGKDLTSIKIKKAILLGMDAVPLALELSGELRFKDSKSSESVPQHFSLSQNYPNPFNPQTSIRYALPQDARVRLIIYNILGKKVKTLVDEFQSAGYKTEWWDGKGEKGDGVASGVYLYRLEADKFSEVKKMLLVK